MQDTRAPESLRQFQIDYGRYLRNPRLQSLPEGVPERRSEIYENLLFNNVSGFINNCFPVAKSLFSEEQWASLCRAFFTEWRCTTPLFSRIPNEFVRFIAERPIGETLPPWLPELLHYEWVELEVDLHESDPSEINAQSFTLNPTLQLLAYQWPVHTISEEQQPEEAKQTCLLVFRDDDLNVRFTEVNPTTFMLLQLIQQWQIDSRALSADTLLVEFAEHIQHPQPEALVSFGKGLLEDLKNQKILLGEIK